MKLSLLAAATLVMVAPTYAAAQETAARPGYKATGEPITNPAEPGYDPELVVCVKQARTGSRARKHKVCLPNHVWQRVAREGNGFARKMVADHASGMWVGGD